MPGDWIGEPYVTGERECQEGDPGVWTYRDRRDCMWQEKDEMGNPIGLAEPRHYDWLDSGETCVP